MPKPLHIFLVGLFKALCASGASIASQHLRSTARHRTHAAITSTSVTISLGQSELHTLARMKYWADAGTPKPATEKYLLFSPDDGGPNNIRIGWEMAGVIAQYSNRTLVLPPAAPMYLLDYGPGPLMQKHKTETNTQTSVEDLINTNQLKANLPTLSSAEFSQLVGDSWENAVHRAANPTSANRCSLAAYAKIPHQFVFLSGHDRVPFSCGEWWNFGGPTADMKRDMREDGWTLLRQGFVWHDDVFNVAAKVVDYLGLFKYVAVHARYNDFQFHEAQKSSDSIFGKWKPWLTSGTTLYVATDEPSKFKDVELPGIQLIMWDDLFQGTTGNLLSDTKNRFSAERWFKLTGPVEELICTYSKLFVGTDKSSFSGHIERMRIHADAPVTTKLTHTDSVRQDLINSELDVWNQKKASHTVLASAWDRFL